jgi:propanol-preferring alcohol dehydrogenase
VRALQLDERGMSLVEVAEPVVRPGAVVIDVQAAGLCHSDLILAQRDPAAHPFPLPQVLGHEIAGVVSETGAGVDEVSVGDQVVVYGPWGCGACRACRSGAENVCPFAREAGILPPGLGAPGGLADRVLVPLARHVVPAPGLDPLQAAVLTDAGVTAYGAVQRVLAHLPADSTAVVVGVGGLGHVAVQVLSALSGCRIVAVDPSEHARALASSLGVDMVLDPSTTDIEQEVRTLTEGAGADAVLDFVASTATLPSAVRMLARGGDLVIVGVGTATVPVGVGAVPLGATVHTQYWGTWQDLDGVMSLARAGRLVVAVTPFALDDVLVAYERLRTGGLHGRAVAVPGAER